MVILLKVEWGYIGIGLLGFILKIYEFIMNNRLQNSITLHNVLHSFGQGRGSGTATMEAKLAQKLSGLCCEPIFQGF